MRIFFLSVLGIAVCVMPLYAQNSVAIDFQNRKIEMAGFPIGNLNIRGDFTFDVKSENEALIFNLEGKNIAVKEKLFPWIKLKIVKRGDTLYVSHFSSPEFLVKGNVNIENQDVFLNVDVNTFQEEPQLKGKISAHAKIWGQLTNYLASGSINIMDGVYQGVEFSSFALNFLGKPPLLMLTDSKIVLKNGSSYAIDGTLSLRDFNNLFPGAAFVSHEVTLDGWRLLAEEDKNVGF
ncbi:MAG: hypothetical protein KKF80_05455, partial [Candidatus Omnitrophica bacterium]|nr:hypothetical protein [Candidatus Omnitrophota bacterium]